MKDSKSRSAKTLGVLVATLIAGASCSRQPVNESQPPGSASPAAANVRTTADVVKVQAPPISISAGGKADATITISISPDFHVNANPATFDYLIPTEVTAQNPEDVTLGKPVYPAAEKRKFQFADVPLAVYEGETRVKLPLTLKSNAAKGTRSIPFSVRVQACDQEKCFPPDTLRQTLVVEVND